MHRVVKICKGLDINLKGAPVAEFTTVADAKLYALQPADFTRVTPKVVVKAGDSVKAGEPLFVDKNCPELQFVSPVSGKVAAVNRGERRRVLSVVVESDGKFESVEYKAKDVLSLSAEEVKADLYEDFHYSLLGSNLLHVLFLHNGLRQNGGFSCFNRFNGFFCGG